jgi:intracellular sulfur oxidation DsrE/DsrF family protein
VALCLALSAGLLAGVALQSPTAVAQERTHKVAVHVDDSDPARINMALNNVQNIKQYYDAVGEKVEIEVVAYGPGLHMLRSDTSTVKERISAMSLEFDGLVFSACGNTQKGMAKKEGKEIELLSEAQTVPSGVVRLVELQEGGYSYVRP